MQITTTQLYSRISKIIAEAFHLQQLSMDIWSIISEM